MIKNDFDFESPVISDEWMVSGGVDQGTCNAVAEDGAFATAGGLGVLSHSLIGVAVDPEPVTKTFCGFVSLLAGAVSAAGVAVSTIAAAVSNATN